MVVVALGREAEPRGGLRLRRVPRAQAETRQGVQRHHELRLVQRHLHPHRQLPRRPAHRTTPGPSGV